MLRRDVATDHMLKDLIDIYETLNTLFFHFGTTDGLSDLLAVSHKQESSHHYVLTMKCMCKFACVGVCVIVCVRTGLGLGKEKEEVPVPSWLTWKDYRKILCHNNFSTPPHRSEFTGVSNKSTEKHALWSAP